ncbi:MAG TPA: pseudouridine synthase [Gordonia sp. (in: high G+C Gram-positive bacteria)]|uniref:pseudouridine synthase n=1 Tax=unclassified Gordonia (in: high G+C Gram-positive bacteria) TaxID=2657482 RepID=UPI0025C2F86A|nr:MULTISPECIES: pseudouridine synthase [unclassified Gordonia (in: high G+C Gram-positive bacteria)]HNP55986.1 pseudouridine synthase [Gordonia sp. (in: high G+C Gram-positive bacteria)]HRC49571.1 pseudouridine synthase [Gordonia sp. (in: high G+C Gram-positive bacteria)]
MDATRVILRHDESTTVLDALLASSSGAEVGAEALVARADAGEVVDIDGRPVALDAPSRRNVAVFFYRDLPVETPIPFDLEILYDDENLVVVDKPHFLATMPRGRHVTQTALVRLRRELGNDALAPVHRLDRLTAGVLVFTRRPAVRAAYQELFAARRVYKEYRAHSDATADEDLRDGIRVANRIEKRAGDLRAHVVDGPVNAISTITRTDDGFRLVPETGRTHQLRMHMAGLGAPIVDDPLYPDVRPELAELPDHGDFSRPLQLVASALRFTDPITGADRSFESRRR